MDELHRSLPGSEAYLGKIVVKKESDIPQDADPSEYITEQEDYMLRRQAIHSNGHLVGKFAAIRLNSFLKKILVNTVGITDYSIRTEFQSRTALHWHMIGKIITDVTAEDFAEAFRKYVFLSEIENIESMDEEEMKKLLDTIQIKNKSIPVPVDKTDEVKARVADARTRVLKLGTETFGLSSVHPQPNPDLWPDNGAPAPAENVLRFSFPGLPDSEADYEYLVNRVQRHKCTPTYCLRKTNEGDYICRFGFPQFLCGYVREPVSAERNSELRLERDVTRCPDGGVVTEEELIFLRNHPFVVTHVPELLSLWRGNIDMKLVTNVEALEKYMTKYIMKEEKKSMSFQDIARVVAEKATEAGPNATVPKTLSQIMLKFVGEHDLSKSECWQILNGDDYVTFSRPLRYLNLTDKRCVSAPNERGDNLDRPARSKNTADRYWSREEDPVFLEVVRKFEEGEIKLEKHPREYSLYQFTSYFSQKWEFEQKIHIVVPTPLYHFIPTTEKEEHHECYCRTSLLLHKPGCNPDNFLKKDDSEESYATAHDALDNFVKHDPRCPKRLRSDWEKFMSPYLSEDPEAVEDLIPDDDTDGIGNFEQDDWMIAFGGEVQRDTTADDQFDIPADEFQDETDDSELNCRDPVLRSADRLALAMTNQDISEATKWLKEQMQNTEDHSDATYIDPSSLNAGQRKVFDCAMQSFVAADPYLMDLNGGAGSGECFSKICL